VDPADRGQGIGKRIVLECIRKAKEKNHNRLFIHTTMTMQTAGKMYEDLGFKRSEDLDFFQGKLRVFGFKLIF
jgi:GNAT superfamily N-acetyltransferase